MEGRNCEVGGAGGKIFSFEMKMVMSNIDDLLIVARLSSDRCGMLVDGIIPVSMTRPTQALLRRAETGAIHK